ncbi:LON peptidase substrate-binding domain-containing protein [Pseudoxanthomonas japonensis]|jgi:Lon protease-like protein|uniref:LON peptidase substrate-binding domain-containing protein n=1 Tax=Pseudoxanthomonas japonensis TaxID=69284 RepID=UPI000DB01FD8|nr:LON peptidase substrate-binding domain-containing protein [Pseudoxanthomonas japonensis]MCR6624964.1 LON peptidase substrate-binding domain-containing protein [Pseudoxanthomonas sp.]NCT69632.1 ATP-dependent protease [Xanthomonadaceae bacterium]PZQ24737.1 MAG: ATP-dependent protease [Stenotrophomonas acidaminiphila]
MTTVDSLPLFPLHKVLLPGAAMDLRIFERRYLDLVRDCGRSGGGFGVCLILEGSEAGAPATPAAYGVEARIENFDMGEDGLLSLRVRGHRRFHVVRTRVRDNGLVMADVEWLHSDEDLEILPEHALLGTLLQTMMEKVGTDISKLPARVFEHAGWVGWRLAQVLPITPLQRVSLLQENDVNARLQRLLEWID